MRAFRRNKQVVRAILICFFVVVLSACAGLWPERIGRIVPDREAALIFEKKQCGDDYQYYYSGSDLYPSALTAVFICWSARAMKPLRLYRSVRESVTERIRISSSRFIFSVTSS